MSGVTQITNGIYELDVTFNPDEVALLAILDPATGTVNFEGSAPSPATKIILTRTHPSGRQVTVRSADHAPLSGGLWIGYDYELPIGRECSYVMQAIQDDGTVVGQSEPQTILWDTHEEFLKDPLLPGRNLQITTQSQDDEVFPTPVGVNDVIGRATPVVITDVRSAEQSTLRIVTLDLDAADAVHLLTSTGHILLWQTHPDFGLGNLYMAIQQVTESRLGRLGAEPSRAWALQYLETDAPIGDVIGGDITYQTVLDTFQSYQDLLNQEPTYLALVEGQGMGVSQQETLAWRGA